MNVPYTYYLIDKLNLVSKSIDYKCHIYNQNNIRFRLDKIFWPIDQSNYINIKFNMHSVNLILETSVCDKK